MNSDDSVLNAHVGAAIVLVRVFSLLEECTSMMYDAYQPMRHVMWSTMCTMVNFIMIMMKRFESVDQTVRD